MKILTGIILLGLLMTLFSGSLFAMKTELVEQRDTRYISQVAFPSNRFYWPGTFSFSMWTPKKQRRWHIIFKESGT